MSIVEQPAKAIYLANRHPRLTREEFRERWMTHSRVGDLLAGGPGRSPAALLPHRRPDRPAARRVRRT